MRLLIIYSTIDGHTLEICERIAAIVRDAGHEAELAEVAAVSAAQLDACDRVACDELEALQEIHGAGERAL